MVCDFRILWYEVQSVFKQPCTSVGLLWNPSTTIFHSRNHFRYIYITFFIPNQGKISTKYLLIMNGSVGWCLIICCINRLTLNCTYEMYNMPFNTVIFCISGLTPIEINHINDMWVNNGCFVEASTSPPTDPSFSHYFQANHQ